MSSIFRTAVNIKKNKECPKCVEYKYDKECLERRIKEGNKND